jgi:hypothetical protein
MAARAYDCLPNSPGSIALPGGGGLLPARIYGSSQTVLSDRIPAQLKKSLLRRNVKKAGATFQKSVRSTTAARKISCVQNYKSVICNVIMRAVSGRDECSEPERWLQ